MTKDVSRRNFVALAGAGVALGACSGNKGNSGTAAADTASIDSSAVDKILAEFSKKWKYENHGKDPHKAPEYVQPTSPKNFEPEFIQIVHIRLKSDWSLNINHAHFKIPDKIDSGITDDSWRLQTAIKIIKKKNPSTKLRFQDINGIDPKPFDRSEDISKKQYADETIFKSLDFGSPHEVFIYLDSKNAVLVRDNLISFAPTRDGEKIAQENYSFFKARPVEDVELGDELRQRGVMIRMENHYTDKSGNLITKESVPDGKDAKPGDKFWYAMNIHFALPVRGYENQIGFVPMVIDPDTGNGMGNNP